jgi:hypothetical protein
MIISYLNSLVRTDNNNIDIDDKIIPWYLILVYAYNNMIKNMMYNNAIENNLNP